MLEINWIRKLNKIYFSTQKRGYTIRKHIQYKDQHHKSKCRYALYLNFTAQCIAKILHDEPSFDIMNSPSREHNRNAMWSADMEEQEEQMKHLFRKFFAKNHVTSECITQSRLNFSIFLVGKIKIIESRILTFLFLYYYSNERYTNICNLKKLEIL